MRAFIVSGSGSRSRSLVATTSTTRCRLSRRHGFTLLEVMVSLAIFALLSVAGYQLLTSLTLAGETTLSRAQQRWELENSLLLMEQDMLFLLARSGRSDEGGRWLPPLSSRHGSLLAFSRAGLPVDGGVRRYAPARVVYRLEEHGDERALVREIQSMAEKTVARPPVRQHLLTGLRQLSVRFQSGEGAWYDHWPPAPVAGQAKERLPAAVEFVLTFPERAPLRRLISRR